MSSPYTYYLYHKPTNKSYYGAQWGKNVSPNNFWVTYFTSSKIVKNLIDEYGTNSFEFKIRKIFDTPEKAMIWEQKVIRRMNMVNNDNWLNQAQVINNHCSMSFNQHIRDKISKTLTGRRRDPASTKLSADKNRGKQRTSEQKIKMSNLQKLASGYGPKKHTNKSKKKMSQSLKGRILSDQHKVNISIAQTQVWEERLKSNWIKPESAAVLQGYEKQRGKSRSNQAKENISKGKVGKKRKYLPNGSYIMVNPSDIQKE